MYLASPIGIACWSLYILFTHGVCIICSGYHVRAPFIDKPSCSYCAYFWNPSACHVLEYDFNMISTSIPSRCILYTKQQDSIWNSFANKHQDRYQTMNVYEEVKTSKLCWSNYDVDLMMNNTYFQWVENCDATTEEDFGIIGWTNRSWKPVQYHCQCDRVLCFAQENQEVADALTI